MSHLIQNENKDYYHALLHSIFTSKNKSFAPTTMSVKSFIMELFYDFIIIKVGAFSSPYSFWRILGTFSKGFHPEIFHLEMKW